MHMSRASLDTDISGPAFEDVAWNSARQRRCLSHEGGGQHKAKAVFLGLKVSHPPGP